MSELLVKVLAGICLAMGLVIWFLWWQLDSAKDNLAIEKANATQAISVNKNQSEQLTKVTNELNGLVEQRKTEEANARLVLQRTMRERDQARREATQLRNDAHAAMSLDPACEDWGPRPVCPAAARSLRVAACHHANGDGGGQGAGQAACAEDPARPDPGSSPP